MKPLLIIGTQVILLVAMLYLTGFTVHYLDTHWTAYPTYLLCCTGILALLFTLTTSIVSYYPGPKQ